MDRKLDPTLKSIINNNAESKYGSGPFLTQPTERPRSGLSQRGFSAGARPIEYHQKYDHSRPISDVSSSLNGFGKWLAGFSLHLYKCP